MSDAAWRRGFARFASTTCDGIYAYLFSSSPKRRSCATRSRTRGRAQSHGFPGTARPKVWRLARVHADYRVLPQCLCETFRVWPQGRTLGLRGNRAIVLETVDIFGADRCMFASNFPVAGLRIDFTSLYDAYKRMVRISVRRSNWRSFTIPLLSLHRAPREHDDMSYTQILESSGS